ncbi:MAG: IclR family transcriptional regulator [Solirubrobacteraceae bacterium]
MLNTVARVGTVLNLFTADRPEWGVTEVATTLELPKSNAHDMLTSLAHIGFLAKTANGRYRLGWRLLAMSRSLMDADGFQRQSVRIVEALSHRLGEAASVATWDGRSIVCVASDGLPRAVERPERAPGVRLAGHSTGLGKMLLAHRPWSEVEERVESDGLPPLTERTVGSIDRLRDQLVAARQDAIALDREESHAGLTCVAAPVRNADSQVIAALSISMATARFERAEAQFARAATVAAGRLSSLLEPGPV